MSKPRLLAVAFLLVLPLPALTAPSSSPAEADPYLWLEDVGGDQSLAWARARNAISQRELEAHPEFTAINERLLALYDSDERIPYVAKRGGHYYNFWRDARHVRGLWRRTSLEEYRQPNPAWEVVLDLDALARAENENWVWKGSDWLEPDLDRCLLRFSRGGADAVVVREFDPVAKAFVAGGFTLPEAKSAVAWRSRDVLYVGTDFGPGTLTDSGYPRVVKEWRRGTPLADARVVFEGTPTDVSASAYTTVEPGFRREFARRSVTFFTAEHFLREGDAFRKLDLPADARQGTWREFITVTLRSDWKTGGRTYPAGALLALPWARFLAGNRDFALLFEPGPRKSLAGTSATRHHLLVNELENVRSRIFVLTPRPDGGWSREALAAPEFGNVSATAIDDEGDDFWLQVEDFLTPPSLYRGTVGRIDRELLKQLPAFFAAAGLAVAQHEATSADGTRIPYFQVSSRGLKHDGTAPTLLYGYGGFQIAQRPGYRAALGAAWLERGGVFVLANLRGGGEFGPAWHQAALKGNRQRAFDDFIAVAEDLVRRRVTSPRHLGIQGGSNGGLLVGAVFVQRPDLFNAVVCQVPLLDMRRFHRLLAGASWMGEYGNPDVPAEWEWISRYSPYQNVRAGVKYPRVLFTTSTRDDRVHPGHARKMVARMLEQGHDVLYYENIEGGHGGAANNRQAAYMSALAYAFLLRQLR
jgi:prolyl oligopeptidase